MTGVYTCHPEALFWAKDLPECVGRKCRVAALRPGILAKKPGCCKQTEASREVLRQKMAQDDKQKGFELMEKGTAA